MLRLFKIENGLMREFELPLEKPQTHLPLADWIDAHDPTEEERSLLKVLLHTDAPEFADVEEIEASARCFVDQAGIHIHTLFLVPTEGRYSTVSVACILQKNCLITMHEGELSDFKLLVKRAQRGRLEVHSPSELLVTVLEQKVENHADTLEDLHQQLEEVSHLVLEVEGVQLSEAIHKLTHLEDSNGKIRLCLMDTQLDISFLMRHLRGQPEQLETLNEIMRDLETLMSHSTFLFEKVGFLMDSTQSSINIRQNKIIKTFSIAAVVFLPPTLIASIYGMNFEHIPELSWLLGYPWAIGLMIASGIAPYWYFKRKNWL